jgi:hypothetical protein
MAFRPAPLSSGYMLASILGFLISVIAIVPFSLQWGVTLALIFGMMFIASVISMTYAPIEAELEIDYRQKKAREGKKKIKKK